MGRSPSCGNEGVNRGAWSAQEDELLTTYIKIHGEGKWRSVPQKTGLKRCGKSCRLRWLNYLRPGIKRGDISMEEEDLIIRLHRLLGNRWALIAGRLPGRTANEIKNYWNTTLVKKLNGQTSRPSVVPFKFEEKKPVENSAPNIPQVIQTKVLISPEEGEHLLNTNVGHTPISSFPVDDDSFNFFLMDFNVDEVLAQDGLSSDFSQIHIGDMRENGGNMVGGDNICASSSDYPISEDVVLLENGMIRDPIQPNLELELQKVASFLDLEDERKEL